MPSGLAALLDDVAGIAKIAAASVDDVGAATAKAGSKAIGIVVDDTAVTPRYVTGFTPDRELPIIAKIAKGSLFNKLVILLPVALLLSALLPWAITPLLAIGGAYLCFEGAEKVIEAFTGHEQGEEVMSGVDPAEHEKTMVKGAIRTDFILSAEIMAIALAEVADLGLVSRAAALVAVALAITVGVYGLVGLIVKMDDIGLSLAKQRLGAARAFGRGLVLAMPKLMKALSVIGTAAMIWVGGGIILHGLEQWGLGAPYHWIHDVAHHAAEVVPGVGGFVDWLINAAGAGVFGLLAGALIVGVLHLVRGGHGHGKKAAAH